MRPIFAAAFAFVVLGSAAFLVATPPGLSPGIYKVVGLMPAPPAKPLPPMPEPPAPPVPPAPMPPVPSPEPRPPLRRCEVEKPHTPHDWKDAAGQPFHCDGRIDPKPRF